MKALLVLLIGTLLSQLAQAQTVQTVNRTMQLAQNYSLTYFTHNINGPMSVRFFLRLDGVDISNWTNSGQYGIWLGLGFGSSVMLNAPMIQCQLMYTGNPALDKFICNDRYGVTDKSVPVLTANRTTTDILTQINTVTRTINYNTGQTQTLASFIAVFDHPCNPKFA